MRLSEIPRNGYVAAMTCQLYLLTPPRIAPDFVDTLVEALDAGAVAALRRRRAVWR